jgi:protein gp37
MSANTSIEWTDTTWNPVRGCALVSEGCRNCYAMKVAHRFSGAGAPYEGLTEIGPAGPRWIGRARTVPDALLEPLSWKKPRRVFVNSMSDLFHEDVPDPFIDQVFAVMALARLHTFQVLTKRPERMRAYVASRNGWGCGVWFAAEKLKPAPPPRHWYHAPRTFSWPLPNVWLGVSCENQRAAAERIPLLLRTPAAVRFVSAEPLLGPIDLTTVAPFDDFHIDALDPPDPSCRLHWVIVGGESGPNARPCDVGDIRAIVEQCRTAAVACFVKQLGKWPSSLREEPGWMPLFDADDRAQQRPTAWAPYSGGAGKGGDMAEWPTDLRVRQFPVIHG